MTCTLIPAAALELPDVACLTSSLTRPGSDFQNALLSGTAAGTIAIARDAGRVIGWARSERWEGWDTLESFVEPAYRERGVATFCAAGLVAAAIYENWPWCAVFRQSMVPLAKRLGLAPVHFRRVDGRWRLA